MIKNIILLIFMILIMQQMVKADIVKVDNLYFETEKTFGSNRYLILPEGSDPKYNVNGGLDMSDKLGITYSSSKISTIVDQSQFRYVGFDSEFGVNTTLGMQVYIRHFSGHLLDAYDKENRFPQANVIGLRFNIIGK